MTLRIYRVILSLLVFWIALCVPSLVIPWFHVGFPTAIRSCGIIAGFVAVPVSAVRLWSERTWGLALPIMHP